MKNSVSPSPPGTGSRAKSGWWPPTGRRPWTAPGGAGIFRTSEQITRDFTGRRTQTRTPRAEESVLGSYGPCSGIVSESWQRPGSGRGTLGVGPAATGSWFPGREGAPGRSPRRALLAGARDPKPQSLRGLSGVPFGDRSGSSLLLGDSAAGRLGRGPRPARRGAAHPWPP